MKKFKDPIYGYIEVEDNIAHDIVDSACFQRLRSIRQTGYAPLYHASMHNRFIHSIGVYHLSKLVIKTLDKYTQDDFGFDIKRVFSLASLLHDVGHAPFSHTGEKFFRTVNGPPFLFLCIVPFDRLDDSVIVAYKSPPDIVNL